VQHLQFKVLCGPTGSGKTRLLQALAAQGAQVLDLEALASHRSSVLGAIPGQPQPTQKAFETTLWQTLRQLRKDQPVFVEAESKKVGNLTVPDALIQAMRQSPCIRLDLPLSGRVQLLLEDYAYFSKDPAFFCDRLDRLIDLKGRTVVQGWQEQIRAGQIAQVVAELLSVHYDPGYESSTRRNFVQFDQARGLTLPGHSMEAMVQGAQELLQVGSA
jgi:tRNA 2-selenouridine synthase